jgi:hypothetical protein
MWGNQRTTALSLAGKGTAVTEKCSTHCTLQVPFHLPLNALYYSLQDIKNTKLGWFPMANTHTKFCENQSTCSTVERDTKHDHLTTPMLLLADKAGWNNVFKPKDWNQRRAFTPYKQQMYQNKVLRKHIWMTSIQWSTCQKNWREEIPVPGSCNHSNESSCSIKAGTLLH